MTPALKVAPDDLRLPGHRRETLTSAVALVALFDSKDGPDAMMILKGSLASSLYPPSVWTVRYRMPFRSLKRKLKAFVPHSRSPVS